MMRAPSRDARKHHHHLSIPRTGSARAPSTAMSHSEDASTTHHPLATHRPFLVVERIGILLEEGLFSAAIANARSILFSGISDTPPKPGILVPANFLSFLTTLVVHPFYTTQTRTKASPQKAPEEAHIFLKRVIEVVGPISSDLSAAWKFRATTPGGGKRKRSAVQANLNEVDDREEFIIHSPLSEEESLFAVADDLWSVVGWAFNCSVKHKKRWNCYRNVLEVFLLALEDDLKQRALRYEQDKDESHLDGALVLKLLPVDSNQGATARIVRSIFADGSDKAFPMLWPDELKRRREKKKGRKEIGRTIADDDGETDSEAEGSGLSDEEPEVKDAEGDIIMEDKVPKTVNVVDKWGGLDAVELRQRFLTLLSAVSYFGKFVKLHELHGHYRDVIRQMPISSFTLFVSTFLPANQLYRSMLCLTILNTLITTKAPYQPVENTDLSLHRFITAYLPYMANNTTVSDNAKMAIVVEIFARVIMLDGKFIWSQELEDAVETGIAARRKQGRTNKAGHSREETMVAWNGADMRLRLLVKMAKMKKNVPATASQTP